ncbi:MAG: LL-diaminopimelate aminotransferase [Desulfovibrio sp.]|nr:LL-diaminopimelate aminotransferase [Desulfovibrio sp.]
MININSGFLELEANYLFADIERKVAEYRDRNPDRKVISLGIGDVTRPLAPAVVEALHRAVDEMGSAAGFHGYGPYGGYDFLRDAIVEYDYRARGMDIGPDEIFVSDGAKSDVANFQELFSVESIVAVTDPVYPVYVDSNVLAGRAGHKVDGRWSRIVYLPCTPANNFVPSFPEKRPDMIYICSPNNPTGSALRKADLQAWVDYARAEGSVILYDSAYEAFIRDPEVPHSIYECEGARDVAVEFRSFSKTAGFTGLRCAYVVVPKTLKIGDGKGGKIALNPCWYRRQCTKYNGCPYIVQRAAAATYTENGRREVRDIIRGYQDNADLLASAMRNLGLEVFGGVNAPYLWVKTGMDSWKFFDIMLEQAALVCTPGVGFGKSGEGFARLTAFGSPEDTQEAIRRMGELAKTRAL